MGTINYMTSDYITLGVKPYDFDDIKASHELEFDDILTDDQVYDIINDYYDADRTNAQNVLDDYLPLDYFDVKIDDGYYEGFSIVIEPCFEGELYSEEDRQDALADLAQLKKLLLGLADVGLVACQPGWSTGYSDASETSKEINDACDEIKKDIEKEPLEESKTRLFKDVTSVRETINSLAGVKSVTESNSGEKWRELTAIEDYEFDPDGKYDGALYNENWEEIFDQLYQRAETTEEYLDNDWIDPVSTKNAYARRMKKNGHQYIVLKYFDGMYVLYEIAADIAENKSVTAQVSEKIHAGVSVRQAILEASKGQKKVFEDVAGMDKEEANKLLALLDKWTGGSGTGGWVYELKENKNGVFVILVKSNPIAKFTEAVSLDLAGNVLNGELYYKDINEYLAASGPVTFAGLKSILRDLQSQVEMADAEEQVSDGDIYGY